MSTDVQAIKHRVSSLLTTVNQTENTDQVEVLETKVRELLGIITDIKETLDTNEEATKEKAIQALHASQPLKQFIERPNQNCSKQSSFLEEAMQKQKSQKDKQFLERPNLNCSKQSIFLEEAMQKQKSQKGKQFLERPNLNCSKQSIFLEEAMQKQESQEWSWFGAFDTANTEQKQEEPKIQKQHRVFSIPTSIFASDDEDDVSSTEFTDGTDSERLNDPITITCISPAGTHKKINNRANLQKFKQRMSTTMGVNVRPGFLAEKNKRLSLRDQRVEMTVAGAKPQESYRMESLLKKACSLSIKSRRQMDPLRRNLEFKLNRTRLFKCFQTTITATEQASTIQKVPPSRLFLVSRQRSRRKVENMDGHIRRIRFCSSRIILATWVGNARRKGREQVIKENHHPETVLLKRRLKKELSLRKVRHSIDIVRSSDHPSRRG